MRGGRQGSPSPTVLGRVGKGSRGGPLWYKRAIGGVQHCVQGRGQQAREVVRNGRISAWLHARTADGQDVGSQAMEAAVSFVDTAEFSQSACPEFRLDCRLGVGASEGKQGDPHF